MGGRVYRAGITTPPSPPMGRVYRSSAVGTAPTVTPRGRVYRSGATGTVPATIKGRVYRSGAAGTPSVIVAPIPAMTVEPLSSVEVTALLVDGTPADAYTWRQISGPTVSFVGVGHTRSFIAPSDMAGTTVVLGVRATTGGTTSPEANVTVIVMPQITWTRTHIDPVWRGSKITL